MRRAGRGLALTESGEVMLSYARRLLDLNDEAVSAVRRPDLEGWVRLGIQEDFGESVLPQVLGRFARAHPKVRVEGRIGRNNELREKIASGQLDLALAWDDGTDTPAQQIASLPLCWLGSAQEPVVLPARRDEPLPLASLEAPCLLRNLACSHLDREGIAWRIAFISPSLGGLWAATAAGLGIALRTPFGRPETVRVLDPAATGPAAAARSGAQPAALRETSGSDRHAPRHHHPAGYSRCLARGLDRGGGHHKRVTDERGARLQDAFVAMIGRAGEELSSDLIENK